MGTLGGRLALGHPCSRTTGWEDILKHTQPGTRAQGLALQ